MVSEQSLQHWALNRATLELWHIYIFSYLCKTNKTSLYKQQNFFEFCVNYGSPG
jgi:hypothetical protein